MLGPSTIASVFEVTKMSGTNAESAAAMVVASTVLLAAHCEGGWPFLTTAHTHVPCAWAFDGPLGIGWPSQHPMCFST